ncbi:MAG: hypothetical protein ACJAZ0_000034 [Halioglobus sp.]|jgi:hypothetical protein
MRADTAEISMPIGVMFALNGTMIVPEIIN